MPISILSWTPIEICIIFCLDTISFVLIQHSILCCSAHCFTSQDQQLNIGNGDRWEDKHSGRKYLAFPSNSLFDKTIVPPPITTNNLSYKVTPLAVKIPYTVGFHQLLVPNSQTIWNKTEPLETNCTSVVTHRKWTKTPCSMISVTAHQLNSLF